MYNQLRKLYIYVLKNKHSITYYRRNTKGNLFIELEGKMIDIDINLKKTKYLAEREIINFITGSYVSGHYDTHIKSVVVYFHNKKESIVAYLRKNMVWDVRGFIHKNLYARCEETEHYNIEEFEINSKVDKEIRNILNKIIEDNPKQELIKRMKEILNDNSY